jgi:pSer/pThr/pTyr-binding forkhead associated (FHA) protein
MASLEVHLPDGRIERLELGKANMTIGRSPQADLRIDDPEISRLHARMDKTTKNRWSVTDLDSRNETYFQNRAIKSHTLTHMDTFYFGSIQIIFLDTSGDSDKKIDMTVYKNTQGQAITPVEKKFACPLCKADMSTKDIVCTRCGYNMQTGEAMKVEVEEEEEGGEENIPELELNETPDSNGTTTASESPKLKRRPDFDAPPVKPIFVNKQWQLFIDWWLPISLFVIASLLILKIQNPIDAGITMLSLIFRTVLMLFTMALATKFANFQLGCFWDALVKILAITSMIALFEIPHPVFGIVASLIILVGLIKLFFNPDLFGWMLSALVMFFLNTLLISNFMLPQLRKLFETP